MFSSLEKSRSESGHLPRALRGGASSSVNEFTTDSSWFAVWTKSRQEKVAAATIKSIGLASYLPLKAESRQWCDRKQTVLVPLFSGYVFVRMSLADGSRIRVLNVPGVAGLVGNGRGPLPIPDQQIEAVRTVLAQGIDCTPHPLLEEGDLVRVVRGPLAGVEGRLLRINSLSRLVISIALIQRSLSVTVSRNDVEPAHNRAA